MSKCQLIQGDCLVEMDKLIEEGVKVDMVLTDPPYGATDCKWDSILPFDEMWSRIKLLTNITSPIILFGNEPFSSKLRLSNINDFKYDWIWYKNTISGFPFAKYQPLRNHEIISVFYSKFKCYNPIKEERDETLASRERRKYMMVGGKKGEIYGDLTPQPHMVEGLSFPKTIKRFKTVPSAHRCHPSQKPVELLEYLIKTYTNENDTVLDFTMGSGSTGVACLQTNRNFIGIELDENYYNLAKERCSEYQSKLW